MEIYEDVADPDSFDAALAACLQQHAVERFLDDDGSRHVERFVACA